MASQVISSAFNSVIQLYLDQMALLRHFALVLLLTSTTVSAAEPVAKDDQTVILKDVKTVVTTQSSGFLCVYGDSSFPLLMGSRNGVLEPVAAGGRLGNGRLAAFGHDAALDHESTSDAASNREMFLDNLFEWVGLGKKKSVLFIWSCHNRQETIRTLKLRFNKVDTLYISWKNSKIDQDLKAYDAVVVLGEFSDGIVETLKAYVSGGGGLVMAATNWWYGYMHKSNLKNWAPRLITKEAGFIWKQASQEFTDGEYNATHYSALGTLKGKCVLKSKPK